MTTTTGVTPRRSLLPPAAIDIPGGGATPDGGLTAASANFQRYNGISGGFLAIAGAARGIAMSITGRFVAHFGADINYVRVFDEKGVLRGDEDAVCLGDMMAELVDEMARRGFDPETATFAIDRR
jgi:hypothetical protein